MWRRRRRLQQLETEVAQGKAERAELRRRLEWFEAIAAAAGAPPGADRRGAEQASTRLPKRALTKTALPQPELPGTGLLGTGLPGTGLPGTGRNSTPPSAPLPPALLAAARDLRGDDVAVRLKVAGADVVAVVGGPGDPREWWTAIWQAAGQETAHQEEEPA
ncbi:MAG TPA: hypothetical protein VMB74_10000 [Streptosporangiaceae bacterium]|nr:hypothetical protein [Streptosporangiaceae bacterium]